MIKPLFLKFSYFDSLKQDLFRGSRGLYHPAPSIIWQWLAAYSTYVIDPDQDLLRNAKEAKQGTAGKALSAVLKHLVGEDS